MNAEEIRKKVKEFSRDQEWNHQYDFGNGIKTRDNDINSPGYNLAKWPRLQPILDEINLSGKRVLDVGSSDGFYSMKCAQMGANVLGVEIDDLRVLRANFALEVLDVPNVSFISKNLHDFKDEEFDVILGLGLLHRLPNICEFLEKVAVMSDILILEYKTFDSIEDELFDGKKQTKLNEYNSLHGVPTNKFVKNRLTDLGYLNIEFVLDEISHLVFKRSICIARRQVDNVE